MENSSEERIICILSVDLDITNNYLAVILYLFPKKLNSTLVIGLIRTRLRGKYKKRVNARGQGFSVIPHFTNSA